MNMKEQSYILTIGKQFVPTQAGNLYMERARDMIAIHSQYEKELKSLKGEHSGELHLGIHPRRTLYLLPAVIMAFSQRYPDIHIVTHEMTSIEMFDGLANGSLDVIITNKKNDHPYFTWTPYYQDCLVAILAAEHPAVSDGVTILGQTLPWLDLSQLSGERFILQKKFQSSRYYTDIALQYFGIKPANPFIIENLETSCQLAAEGYGIAFNFHTYAQHFSYHKPVKFFLTGDHSETIDFFMVTNSQKYQPHYLGEFMDTLKQAFAAIS